MAKKRKAKTPKAARKARAEMKKVGFVSKHKNAVLMEMGDPAAKKKGKPKTVKVKKAKSKVVGKKIRKGAKAHKRTKPRAVKARKATRKGRK